VSDHSRKDAERIVAKRLAQEDSFFVGQDVNIKQKTKQRQGTILKVNPTCHTHSLAINQLPNSWDGSTFSKGGAKGIIES
jgi:hypothetical protein